MNSKEYWKQRECLIEDENFQNTMYHVQKIKEQYEFAKDNIQKEIYKFYEDFAINNAVKLSEAKRILNNNELKEFKTTLKQYEKMIQNDTEGVLKQKILNISIKHRLTRLQALQAKIDIILSTLENDITTEINDNFFDVLENSYYKNIYEIEKYLNIHTDFAFIDLKAIDRILTYNWSGVSYSDRIWRNQSDLKQKLKDALNKNFIQGTNIAKVSVELSKILDSNYKNCVRLVRTEVNYIENKTSIESYKEKDIKQYIFVAVLDLRTSDLCSNMDGEIINIEDLVVGVNCPPLHPYCRSTVIPYIEGIERNRVSKDILSGKTEEIGNLSYKEWYKKYVEGRYNQEQISNIKKRFLNYSSDKEQYSRYKSVLKNDIPETFDKFQNLKYNNVKEWRNLKSEYLDAIGIDSESKAKQYIRNIDKTINEGKQGKHIIEHNNYIDGRSYLTISNKEAQSLIDRYAGTGEINFGRTGKWNKQEIIYSDKMIGVSVNSKKGNHDTNAFKIHYSKDGVHIVPFWKGE